MDQYIEFIGNHYILSAAWVAVFIMVIYTFIGARLRGFNNANTAQAIQLINQENAVVVDVREENEFLKGHIVNSIHVPLSYFNDRVKDLEKYKDKPIIVGCRSGQRSASACATLKKNGFEKVYNLAGGVMAWQNDNLPLTKK